MMMRRDTVLRIVLPVIVRAMVVIPDIRSGMGIAMSHRRHFNCAMPVRGNRHGNACEQHRDQD